MDNNEIVKRCEALKRERSNLDSTYDMIERFVLPLRGGRMFSPTSSESEVDWRRREIYDDTAIFAAETLAASIHGALTSPAIQWFDFRFGNNELKEDEESNIWLSNASRETYLALQESNFNVEINLTYLDSVAFGTSAPVSEWNEEKGEVVFSNVPIKELFFEEDIDGKALRVYRVMMLTPAQIIDRWPDAPEEVHQKAEKADSNKMEVIFAIYKRKDGTDPTSLKGTIAPLNRRYGYKYVLAKTKETLGKEGGYYEMPVYITHYRRTSGSKYGYSPSMVCLSNIINLNQLIELVLKNAEKAVDPPMMTTNRGVIGDIDLKRAGLTVVRDMKALAPIPNASRFDVAQMSVADLRDTIYRAFHIDQLQLKDSPAMTATEVNVRFELMQRILGPTLASFQENLLSPLVTRTFKMLVRAGKIPEPPQAVTELGSDIEIQYLGPMHRAQKSDLVNSIQQWLAMLLSFAEVNPGVMEIPDFDRIARGTGEMMSVPPEFMKRTEDVQAAREQQQQQQQMMAGAQAADVLSGAAKNFAQAEALTRG